MIYKSIIFGKGILHWSVDCRNLCWELYIYFSPGLHWPVLGELCCGRGRYKHSSTWAQRLEVPHGKKLWTQRKLHLAFVLLVFRSLYLFSAAEYNRIVCRIIKPRPFFTIWDSHFWVSRPHLNIRSRPTYIFSIIHYTTMYITIWKKICRYFHFLSV